MDVVVDERIENVGNAWGPKDPRSERRADEGVLGWPLDYTVYVTQVCRETSEESAPPAGTDYIVS